MVQLWSVSFLTGVKDLITTNYDALFDKIFFQFHKGLHVLVGIPNIQVPSDGDVNGVTQFYEHCIHGSFSVPIRQRLHIQVRTAKENFRLDEAFSYNAGV